MCLILFTLLPLYLAIMIAIPIVAFAAGLAFYQVNGRPPIVVLEHAFMYLLGHKLYLWKQNIPKSPSTATGPAAAVGPVLPSVPKLSESKLRDLAWSLNIKDRAALGVKGDERTGFEM